MIVRNDDDEGIVNEVGSLVVGIAVRRPSDVVDRDENVDGPAIERRECCRRLEFCYGHLEVRSLACERFERGDDKRLDDAREGTDRDGAGSSIIECREISLHPLDLRADCLRVLKDKRRLRGQTHPPAIALRQRHSERT